MEEPERENIKLPFLQGCNTLCLTKTCTNCNYESLKVTHTIHFTLQDTLERTVAFFFHLTQIQHVFYEHSALGFCLYCRLEYSVGMSVLIWCEQPQVSLWQQRAPRGLSIDVSLYNLKQGFSTRLPMGRWSICGSPKSLWALFSLLPSTWAVTYPTLWKGSHILWHGDQVSQEWREVSCSCHLPGGPENHLTASQFCTLWHSIEVLSLWWHFLLFPCSSVQSLQKAPHSH